MRRPEPWYWNSRKGWYVQIEKKQRPLGRDENPRLSKSGDPVPSEDVMREYHRLMATNGMIDEKDRLNLTVAEAADLFVDGKSHTRKSTIEKHAWFAQKLVDGLPKNKKLALVKTEEVRRVAESQKGWGPGTKHHFVAEVKTFFNWSMTAGYLTLNPIGGFENPYPKVARERGMTDAEFWALMDHSKDLQFKQIMQFLRGTGCRPGEARAVEACHVHKQRPVVVLPPELHKTGRRTGKPRIIRMPKDVDSMVRALCSQFPTGSLFRNSRNGGPWSRSALHTRVRKYRRRLGLAEDVVPYLIRHAAVTKLLSQGTDLHLAAKIVGHAGVNMTQSVYFHPEEEKMAAEIEKAFDNKRGDVKP